MHYCQRSTNGYAFQDHHQIGHYFGAHPDGHTKQAQSEDFNPYQLYQMCTYGQHHETHKQKFDDCNIKTVF